MSVFKVHAFITLGRNIDFMEEVEIIKHTRKTRAALKNKGFTVWHKTREVIIEILIILFAVSLSIWLHQQSERRHERKVVKEFLLGLREDLESDIMEMKTDMKAFTQQGRDFTYLYGIKFNEKRNKDSIVIRMQSVYGNTAIVPNNGRFEGFKSAGKLGLIKNNTLQNDILDLYQELLPYLLGNTNYYNEYKNRLRNYLTDEVKRTSDSTSNIAEILLSEKAHNLYGILNYTNEIVSIYKTCIGKAEKIINAINKQYD